MKMRKPNNKTKNLLHVGMGRLNQPARNPADQLFLTRQEVANRLKRNIRTVDKWHKQGSLPMFKIGRSVLIKWSDVEECILNKHRLTNTDSPFPQPEPSTAGALLAQSEIPLPGEVKLPGDKANPTPEVKS